jgi:hypothetical protein
MPDPPALPAVIQAQPSQQPRVAAPQAQPSVTDPSDIQVPPPKK